MKYLKYILVILAVISALLVMILIYNDKITQNSPLYYKQGIDFYNNGDYQNAYYNFGKIKWISPLYNMSLYRQAKSAQKIGDYETAILKYTLFIQKDSNSVFAKNAVDNLAKCYFYQKRYEEAKAQFEKLDIYNDAESEKNYYLALIERKNDKEKAAKLFIKYLDDALYKKEAKSDYILSSADELSSLGVYLDNNAIKMLAFAYYESKDYDEALKYYSKLPLNDFWPQIVIANHNAGNKLIAKKLIESSLNSDCKNIDPELMKEIYNIYASYLSSSKQKNWQKIYTIVKENTLPAEDYVMYKIAGMSSKDKALDIYEDLIKKYPESNYAPESMWNVFWHNYLKNNYTKALEIASLHTKTFQNAKSTPKIMFWEGKIFLKKNKVSEAHNIFSKLINKYPDNYYGLRSESILSKKNDFFKTNKTDKISAFSSEIEFPISFSEIDIKDLKLFNTLFDLGDYEIWADADFNNPLIDSWIEYKKGNKSKSIVMARNYTDNMEIKPPLSSGAYKLVYPLYYIDEINIAGQKLNLDPFLIMALIREESYFNESAKSPANATGLMQIMPATADYMMGKLSYEVDTTYNLEDARSNLFIGCNYLRYLEDRFNNDLYVVAAYNGGEGSVNKWINTYSVSDYDEFIEQIPFEETQNYVKKVFRSYHMYKKIYK